MMISVPLGNFSDFEVVLALSFILLMLGLYGLTAKKSAIKIIMAIEILVAAPNLVFIAYGFGQGAITDTKTEAFVIISLAVGAAVIGLALAILRNLWRHFKSTDVGDYTTLKW